MVLFVQPRQHLLHPFHCIHTARISLFDSVVFEVRQRFYHEPSSGANPGLGKSKRNGTNYLPQSILSIGHVVGDQLDNIL